MNKIFLISIIILLTMLFFGCTQTDQEIDDSASNDLDNLPPVDNNPNDEPLNEGDLDTEASNPDLDSDPQEPPVIEEPAFKDCGTVDVGRVNSFEEYKDDIVCYLERAEACKQTTITVKSETNLGEEIMVYGVIGGDTNNCEYSQIAEKSKTLFGDISGKSIKCTLDSETYVDEFPSNNNHLYKCSGSLAENLKEILKIQTGEKFQFVKSSKYVFREKDTFYLLSDSDGSVGLTLFKKPTPANGNTVYVAKPTVEASFKEMDSQSYCEIIDNKTWLFNGGVLKCTFSNNDKANIIYYLLKKDETLSLVIVSTTNTIPNAKQDEFENYIKTNVNFN